MINYENFANSNKNEINKIRKDILQGFNLALDSIDPFKCILNKLKIFNNKLEIEDKKYDLNNFENIRIISFGKASIKMAEAILSIVNINEGIIVGVKDDFYGFKNIKYIKGGHPIPDQNSYLAGEEIIKLADSTTDKDLTFVLISGGGSALVESSFISLERMQNLTKELLKKGTNINELNTIRKHLSKIKGGRLIKRLKGEVISLIISDVISDPLDVIASGPTFFDSSTFLDSKNILEKYELIKEYEDVYKIFEKGLNGEIGETLKEGEKLSCNFTNILVATNNIALNKLKEYFNQKGYSILFLGSEIEGLASEVAKVIAGIGKSISKNEIELNKPCAVIFGGETTVIVKGNGIGGRNSELTLYITKFLKDYNFVFSSIGTDGIDGISPAAGAISDSGTIIRASNLGLNLDEFLINSNSFTFFNKLNDAIIIGPTGTNVADIATLVII